MSEGSFLQYVKDTVTILRPMRSIVPRGHASVNRQSPTVSLRCTPEQREDMEQAAKLLDVPLTAFIRWSAHGAALEILKQKKEFDGR